MGCFALRKVRCNILDVKKCDEGNCNFYKTETQFNEDKKKTFERIRTLDKYTQMHISETYYGGKMPWLKGGDR